MIILNTIFLFFLTFLLVSLFSNIKAYFKTKNYTVNIKGTVHLIQAVDDIIAIIVKYKIPMAYRDGNEKTDDYVYYSNIIRNPHKTQEKTAAYVEELESKTLGKPFYLVGKLNDLKIEDVKKLESSISKILVEIFLIAILVGIYLAIKHYFFK